MKQHKYIVYLLPVEGEINVGDWCQNFNINGFPNKYDPVHHDITKQTKLDFFVCSHDLDLIKDNDEVYAPCGKGIASDLYYGRNMDGIKVTYTEVETKYNEFYKIGDIAGYKNDDVFKVIAKLSKGAKWINQYDLLNEDEVQYWVINKSLMHNDCDDLFNSYQDYLDFKNQRPEYFKKYERELIIKVKCSQCETFH